MTLDTRAADAEFARHGSFEINNITIVRTDIIATQRANRQRRAKEMKEEGESKEARPRRSVKASDTDKAKAEASLDGMRATRSSVDTTNDELKRAIAQVMEMRAQKAKLAAKTEEKLPEAKRSDKVRHTISDATDVKKPFARLRAGSDPHANEDKEKARLFDWKNRVTRWPRGEMDEWEEERDLDMQKKMPSLRRAVERVVAAWWDSDADDSGNTSEEERERLAQKRLQPLEPWQERYEAWTAAKRGIDMEARNKERERPELIRELCEKKMRIATVTVDKDLVLSGGIDRLVVNTWMPVEQEIKEDVKCVKFSECGRCIFVAKYGVCEVFCAATGRKMTQFCIMLDRELVTALVSPDGTQVVTVERNNEGYGEVNIYDVERRIGKMFPLRTQDGLLSACYSPDGTQLATSSHMGVTMLWSTENGQRLLDVEEMEHDDEVVGMRFTPDGLHLITVLSGGTAFLWDLATGHRVRTLWTSRGYGDFLSTVTFSPDGAYVMRRYPEGQRFGVYCGNTGKLLYEVENRSGNIKEARFSQDGRHILVIAPTVEVRAVATGKLIIDHGPARTAAFLPLTPAPWWPKPTASA